MSVVDLLQVFTERSAVLLQPKASEDALMESHALEEM
jgi:hypothetical protein